MAREVIDATRQAELEAAERSAAPEKKAEEILKKAQEDAAAMKKEMTRKAREDTVKAEEEAREACPAMMAEAEKKEIEEGARLEAVLAERCRQAVEAVLAELM